MYLEDLNLLAQKQYALKFLRSAGKYSALYIEDLGKYVLKCKDLHKILDCLTDYYEVTPGNVDVEKEFTLFVRQQEARRKFKELGGDESLEEILDI